MVKGIFKITTYMSLFLCFLLYSENIIFPDDALIVDVTKPPYNATPNDDKDDTEAIQKALEDHPSGNKIIYLPNGVYIVSDTLKWSPKDGPHSGKAWKRTILQGQSQEGTIIKLKDNCPGFTDFNTPKAVIWTGRAPAQRFRNAIRNLTVDTGKGNIGAIGIQFIANNQGTLREVTIRSGDGNGIIGLDLSFTDEIGPCLIKNVRIIGFEKGISCAFAVDSITMENIIVEGQKKCGLDNNGQCLSIRKFISRNSVPALINRGVGFVCLIEGQIEGNGDAINKPAIKNEGFLFVRDTKISGYKTGIENISGHKKNYDDLNIEEFVSHPILSLFPSPSHSLRLPIEETPEVEWDDLKNWANVVHFGADLTGVKDSTEAFQKAIDSGKTTVYIPNGVYNIGNTLFIRGKVKRIIGCEARIVGNGLWKFTDGEAPIVVIERLEQLSGGGPEIFKIEHASDRVLVIRHCNIGSYRNTGKGKVFFEDVAGDIFEFKNQKVWARQFNVECETKILNDGGQLWILGLKTERGGTLIHTKNGGKTELLGGFCYATMKKPETNPMFIIEDSDATFVIGGSCFTGNPFVDIVLEKRGEERKILKKEDCPQRTGHSVLPLFVGWREIK